ncbi:hypothetical protein ACX1DX_11910 [Tessaracoccus sp. Y36]
MANWDEGLAVRCSSCRRAVAWAAKPVILRNEVFCSDWCRDEPPATTMVDRNDQWVFLTTYGGKKPLQVANLYGVAHSLVYRTLSRLKSK